MVVPLTQIHTTAFFDDSTIDRPRHLFPGLLAVVSSPLLDLLKDHNTKVYSMCQTQVIKFCLEEPFLFLRSHLEVLTKPPSEKQSLALIKVPVALCAFLTSLPALSLSPD